VVFGAFDGSTCLYDVKVMGQGGQEGYLYKVDLCTVTNVNLLGRRVSASPKKASAGYRGGLFVFRSGRR